MTNRVNESVKRQVLTVGLIFLLLLAATPVAAQSAGGADHSYSGDDAYDPAAGGTPELSVASLPHRIIEEGAVTFSGDDAYDPAAGGTPELSVASLPHRIIAGGAVTLSGDDTYDPAAGGTPEFSVAGFVWSSGARLACGLPADELQARRSRSVEGGFSGDDPYDPAAGGTPELSLLAFSVNLVACAR